MNPENQINQLRLCGLRGATTSKSNTFNDIETAVRELIQELISRNKLTTKQIVSITFSVTSDLDACFPAAIARKQPGWEEVALLDCQQMKVIGDLNHCIRILALAWISPDKTPQHPYLREAVILRPDRSQES